MLFCYKNRVSMLFNEFISKNRTLIMGFAMISVMLYHQHFFWSNPFVDFCHYFGYWGVEIFLFLSGFGVVHSLKKNDLTTYYKNRAKRLVLPCVFVGSIKFVLLHLGFDEVTNSNPILQITNLSLWYIYAIVVYYAFAPMMMKMINRYGKFFLIATCVFSVGCSFIPFSKSPYYLIEYLGWIFYRLPVFVFGMFLVDHSIKLDLKKILFCGLALLLVCMLLRIKMIKYHWHLYGFNILLMLATPTMCLIGGMLLNNICTIKMRLIKIFSWFGTSSLELYLWHEFVFENILKKDYFVSFNIGMKCIFSLIIVIFFVLVTCFFKQKILSLMKS